MLLTYLFARLSSIKLSDTLDFQMGKTRGCVSLDEGQHGRDVDRAFVLYAFEDLGIDLGWVYLQDLVAKV